MRHRFPGTKSGRRGIERGIRSLPPLTANWSLPSRGFPLMQNPVECVGESMLMRAQPLAAISRWTPPALQGRYGIAQTLLIQKAQSARHREKNPPGRWALRGEFFQVFGSKGSPCPAQSWTGSHWSFQPVGQARAETGRVRRAALAICCRLGTSADRSPRLRCPRCGLIRRGHQIRHNRSS